MKLLRLKLHTPFRSLQEGFEIHFLRDFDMDQKWEFNPYCLAGRNGSGKSNVMEALAAIFYHVECIYLDYRPEGFEADEENPNGFKSEASFPDAYELEYLVEFPKVSSANTTDPIEEPDAAHVKIIKKVGSRPHIEWLNADKFFVKEFTQLDRSTVKSLLPEYVVGYSSGENEILSLPFFKMRFVQYDEYIDRIEGRLDYVRPESRFIFADQTYSQAIFLANYLMQPDEVLMPFLNILGIKKLLSFRIIIRHNKKRNEYHTEEDHGDQYVGEKRLVRGVDSIIDKLKKCATAHLDGDVLYLDYLVTEETKKAFRLLFDNDPISLFHSLQILFTLNLYDVSMELKQEFYNSDSLYVNETIPVLASDERIIRFKYFEIEKKDGEKLLTKAFSDGEYQYLHTIGICLLFKDSNSLFLLDEPETHLNPDWRASFISVLKDCLEKRENPVLQDILLTSHSPFIVSDTKKEYVLVFKKDYQAVSCHRPDFKTFGASVNQITIEIFDEFNTIGEHANNRLEYYWKLYENRDYKSIDGLISNINNEMGDSVEKTFLINRILEKQKK